MFDYTAFVLQRVTHDRLVSDLVTWRYFLYHKVQGR